MYSLKMDCSDELNRILRSRHFFLCWISEDLRSFGRLFGISNGITGCDLVIFFFVGSPLTSRINIFAKKECFSLV